MSSSPSMSNSSSSSNHSSGSAASRAAIQHANENAAKYFAGSMGGIMIFFILYNFLRYIYGRSVSKRHSVASGPIVGFSRRLRGLFVRSVPGFTSLGHATVFALYAIINLCIAFTNVRWDKPNYFAKRMGWIATSNIALIIFLALKNTPLAFLTAYSYERLNTLHQAAGYTTVFCVVLHAVVYVAAEAQSQRLSALRETAQINGIVAGVGMLVMLGSALLLRRLRYEVFYAAHVVLCALVLVTLGLHRPALATRSLAIVIFAGGAWGADRLLRRARLARRALANRATLTALPGGGTRVRLARAPARAVAGAHAFLWVPGVRRAETHPFTILSAEPLEFVIAAYDGFTRDLHAAAAAAERCAGGDGLATTLRASVDGPYGTVPDFAAFDRVVFIAGGSGGTFTFGVAVDLVRKLGADCKEAVIDFVWVVRNREMLSWYAPELSILQTSPLVRLSIHVTRAAAATTAARPTAAGHRTSVSAPSAAGSSVSDADEKRAARAMATATTTTASAAAMDIEKAAATRTRDADAASTASTSSPMSALATVPGRPDAGAVVRAAVAAARASDRVMVAACGPAALMQATRRAAAECIAGSGKSVELHCEQFGW